MPQRPVRPLQPASPVGMELLFFYICPHCNHQVALISPTQPAMAQCDACAKPFPILPVDERGIQYIKLMLDNGRAAVDADFS